MATRKSLVSEEVALRQACPDCGSFDHRAGGRLGDGQWRVCKMCNRAFPLDEQAKGGQ